VSGDDPIEIRAIDALWLRPAVKPAAERPPEQGSRDPRRRTRPRKPPERPPDEGVSADHVDIRA
jgi:hypothetical protein